MTLAKDDRADSVLDRLSPFGAATIYEAQGGGAFPLALATVTPGLRVCGRAFTVTCPPGDNLMLHYAASTASSGEVIVADAGGTTETAVWGDVLTTAAVARGTHGLVVSGAVRDVKALCEMNFPVFALGVCLKGGTKLSRRNAQVPLQFGNVVVAPGDYIVGDDDGVVCIPHAQIERVIEAAAAREAKEEAFRSLLRGGATTVDLFGLSRLLTPATQSEQF